MPVNADVHLNSSNFKAGFLSSVIVSPTSKALLNFDLSALPSGITSADIEKATLYLYVNKVSQSGRVQLSPITSDWVESLVNSSTNVAFDQLQVIESSLIPLKSSFVLIDVTSILSDWIDTPSSNKGLIVRPKIGDSTNIYIDSKESVLSSHPAFIDLVIKSGTGPKGDAGIQGLQGFQGLKGDKGDQGDSGLQGIQGLQGVKGDTGLQGLQGLKGDKGDQGDNGLQGIQGLQGVKGDTGLQGLQGLQGVKGDTGLQGIQGIQGIQGVKGDTGSLGSFAYKLGDTGPGGGIIFFVDRFDDYSGFTYLEAAPTTLVAGVWCTGSTTLLNALYYGLNGSIGSGYSNTVAMLPCGTGAVKSADTYVSPNGTSDWFLPSFNELFTLINNFRLLGLGGFTSTTVQYWTSTGYDATQALYVATNTLGNLTASSKTLAWKTWPIRYF